MPLTCARPGSLLPSYLREEPDQLTREIMANGPPRHGNDFVPAPYPERYLETDVLARGGDHRPEDSIRPIQERTDRMDFDDRGQDYYLSCYPYRSLRHLVDVGD